MGGRRRTLTDRDREALAAAIRARRQRMEDADRNGPRVKISKGHKNHSTNKERSHGAKAKARRSKLHDEQAARDAAERKTKVRAYWKGDRDECP